MHSLVIPYSVSSVVSQIQLGELITSVSRRMSVAIKKTYQYPDILKVMFKVSLALIYHILQVD